MDDLSEMESPAKRLYISKEKNGENGLKWPLTHRTQTNKHGCESKSNGDLM